MVAVLKKEEGKKVEVRRLIDWLRAVRVVQAQQTTALFGLALTCSCLGGAVLFAGLAGRVGRDLS